MPIALSWLVFALALGVAEALTGDMFLLMLGGLVLSTSIPKAFESRGLWFATAYAAMQVGRTVFLLASIPPSRPSRRWHPMPPR